MVHNYSEGGSYYLTKNSPQLHKTLSNGKIIIDIGDFIDDLKNAMEKYFTELKADTNLQSLAKKRMDALSIIENYPFADPSIINISEPSGQGSTKTHGG